MAIDATIVLEELKCISLSDSQGRLPYIWPVLLWIDDDTISTLDLVGVNGPILGNVRVVLRDNMHVGDTADIPFPLGTLGVRFEDHYALRRLILVVALWEKHDAPEYAMWAGCKAFTSELRAAIADNLIALSDDQQRDQIIENMKMRVSSRVQTAITDALNAEDKIAIFLGDLTMDDFRSSDFIYFSNIARTYISLTLADDQSNDYTISGNLEVQSPPITIDLCQAQVDQVKSAQQTVDALNNQLSTLQQQLDQAGPAQKSGIAADIKTVGETLHGAESDLEHAKKALQACRDYYAHLVQGLPTVPTTGAVIDDTIKATVNSTITRHRNSRHHPGDGRPKE